MSPSISLCMIARDEEQLLPGCLESVRRIVDEIVLVDTGSRDDTPRIAREFGARIVERTWNDNFSDARNAGLEVASGTHVLVLDADERLAPHEPRALHTACAQPEFGLGFLALHNADSLTARPIDVLSGRHRLGEPVRVARLFPNHPELRFRGAVHETVAADAEWLARVVGGRPQPVGVPIVHYGEVPELRSSRSKVERNTRLLERSLELEPEDATLAGYLVGEYYAAGQRGDARRLAADHLPRLLAGIGPEPRPFERKAAVRLAGVLALSLVEVGEPGEALRVVSEARERTHSDHPNLLYVHGLALQALGRFEEARSRFESCLALAGRAFDPPVFAGITGVQSRLHVTNCLLAQGQPDEALESLPAVRGPALVPSALLRAEAHLDLGDPQQALRWLGPLNRLEHPPADLFALMHRALAEVTAADGTLAQRARELPGERWIEPRRRSLVDR